MTDAFQPSDSLNPAVPAPPAADAVRGTPVAATIPVASDPFSTSAKPSSATPTSGMQDSVEEEAANLGHTAKDAAGRVTDTAKDEVRVVATEAKQQARELFDTTMQEARDQASTQQHRAAEGMSTVASDLSSMASGGGAGDGLASQLIGEVGSRLGAAASWMSEREPTDLLDEVKRYARRHPMAFIAAAGAAGLLVGRLTSGLVAEAKDDRGDVASSVDTAASPATGTVASDAVYGAVPADERGL